MLFLLLLIHFSLNSIIVSVLNWCYHTFHVYRCATMYWGCIHANCGESLWPLHGQTYVLLLLVAPSPESPEETKFYQLILDLALYSRGLGTRGVYFHYVYMQRDTNIYTIKSSFNSLRSLRKGEGKLWGRKMNSQSDYSIVVGVVSSRMTASDTRIPTNDKSARG